MKKVFIKRIILAFIVLLVIIILFSNIGQNFKYDIFSYETTVQHAERINSSWLKSKSYEEYITNTADYIASVMKDNNFKPLMGDKYFYEWNANIPSLRYASSLEVVTRYGRVVKKYEHDKEFYEDFRGAVNSGAIINKAIYINNIDLAGEINSHILLFDGYNGKSEEEIRNIDNVLISKGVHCVLSPALTGDMHKESGEHNTEFFMTEQDSGLIKLLVNSKTFDQIKSYIKKGYTLKVKSGAEIIKSMQKNVYGVLQGKNPSYKPLIILTYFNGDYRQSGIENNNNIENTVSPSILLEYARSLKLQRFRKPDRTIIFAFISGYQHNEKGLNQFFNLSYDGDIVLLDGLGTDNKLVLSYYKPSRYFIETLEHFAKRNDIDIITKNSFTGIRSNSVYISTLDQNNIKNFDYQNINKSGLFLLAFIGEECYNLDFLSGNVPEIRAFKQIVRENTLIIASITLLCLFLTVFKFQEL